jgi:uncharacterized protein (TIGR00369 family)
VAEQETTVRSRTVTWEDPMAAAKLIPTMSGMDYLNAMMAGELPMPPILRLMNIEPVSLEAGKVVFSVEPDEYHYNTIGTVHAGLGATLMDSAMGCAVHSLLPAGSGYTTLEIKANYVRPITVATGVVYCESKIIHMGGRTATAEARITDAAGKLYAHATTTCLVFKIGPTD